MDSSIITYCKKNHIVLLLLFIWLFRLCFLTQGNKGGVAINKYVVIQIFVILLLALKLHAEKVTFWKLLNYNATKHFAFLYIFGMISIIWSIFPMMSFFFSFENLVCMTAILYLSLKFSDVYQLEKFFIYTIIFIISMFLVKGAFSFRSFHSVTYSSISAMLTMYCLVELCSHNRFNHNSKTLKTGLVFGIIILFLTTSGGAIFSVFLALFAFLLLSQKSTWRMLLFLAIGTICILIVLGYQQKILAVLFPNKSTESILTAHGRTVVWNMINEKVAIKPLLGWGYATVERILPIYCIDAHNSIIGIRGSLGNIGCIYLVFTMLYVLSYFHLQRKNFGFRGIFFAILCAFINSNTSKFLASKAGPCTFTFQFLLVLGAAYRILNQRMIPANGEVTLNNGHEQH